MHRHFIRGGLAATLGLAMAAASQAGSVENEALRRMAPQHAKAWVLKQIEQQKARRLALADDLDVMPPSLVAFDSGRSVNVTVPMEYLSVDFKAVDNRSGFRHAFAYALGPSGQYVSVAYYGPLPSKKVTGLMTSYQMSPFLQPGTYTFAWGYASDVAGNYSYFDQAALAALGNASFTVKNTKGYDVVAPTLQSGKVLTPRSPCRPGSPGRIKQASSV